MAAHLSKRLQDLGFVPLRDYVAQDNGDGQGAFIVQWLSDQPNPFPDETREPE